MGERRTPSTFDFSDLRRRLATRSGREFWRSLEEVAGSREFLDFLHHEFPRQAVGVDRRDFLRLMAASLALAGLEACTRQPTERIVPYVRQPESLVLGEPLYFATAMPLAGFGTGLLAESHEGRPTKIEGNPEHSASLGAADAIAQASVLCLYDPDRSQTITHAGRIQPWGALRAALAEVLVRERPRGGAGVRLLTETVTSPTLAGQIEALLADLPQARWYQYEPCGRDNVRAGSRLAFGEYVETRYQLENAEVVVALDADLFGVGPGRLRYAREFTRARRVGNGPETMSRFYAVESAPSVTGAMADHRLVLRAGEVEPLARALARALGLRVRPPGDVPALHAAEGFVAALTRDLLTHRGASVVIAGDQQPPAVHALAHAMNQALGNPGRTVLYTDSVEARPAAQLDSLRELVGEMAEGDVRSLLIVGGNPVYTAPADLEFGAALEKVPLRVHLSLYQDETSALCHWHVPEAHYLESWSDLRAFDGTVAIVQPLIAPLYEGRTAHELLAACAGGPERSSYEIVREHWERWYTGPDVEAFWRKALHDGVVPGTALPARDVGLQPEWDASPPTEGARAGGGLEVVFRPDPHIFDGRFANNGWLQEVPKPITKLTWDNAALLAPATAERLALRNGDVVELQRRGRSVRAPIWIVPGHAPESVTVHLGYGRARAGRVASGVGFDAYVLRTVDTPDFGGELEIRPTGARHLLASTQHHHAMEGRHLVRAATLAEYRAHPGFARHMGHDPPPEMSLYPGFSYDGHAWGMTIDLARCIGCNACVVACQAENNIPIVGKTEVARGREMHWIRIDRYYEGALDAPEIFHQPVPCMQCENAPCEPVCPVAATVHSSEGLNEMVYNRCVGTRYCANNCPYKVRRLNFFLYSNWTDETLKMARNPDVTVRTRGVMEKCSYCVQRIEHARAEAKREGREIRDGEIMTACEQTCPAGAIVFGDVNDPDSRVARLKADPRSYALLGELNTRPRTSYLAVVRNPHPDLHGTEPAEKA